MIHFQVYNLVFLQTRRSNTGIEHFFVYFVCRLGKAAAADKRYLDNA